MAITKEFQEAVQNEKKIRVRIMLKDIMLVDPTMRQFDEMLNFAQVNMNNLFDVHDEEVLKYDSDDWDEDYLNAQMVAAISNFSKERVELLRGMVRYLYHDKAEKTNASDQQHSIRPAMRKQVGIGVTAVGTAAAVAGICVHQGLLILGGTVAAVIGVGLIVTDGEE